MASFTKVAKTSDIAEGEGKCIEIGDHCLAVFNLGGTFYAIDDACSHEDGPLSEGMIEGDEVECPWHAARFNIKTGEATCPPAYEGVCTYKVRVEGDDVEVELD